MKNVSFMKILTEAFDSLSPAEKSLIIGQLIANSALRSAFQGVVMEKFGGEPCLVLPEIAHALVVSNEKKEEVVAPPVAVPIATAPARTIQGPEQKMKTWLDVLQRFLGGQKIDSEKTRELASKVFGHGVSPSAENWEKIIIPALKKAVNFAVIDSKIAEVAFRSAPEPLLRQYIFGQDGLFVSVSADLADQKQNEIPSWLVAKLYLFTGAAKTLDSMGCLSELEINLLETLINKIEEMKGPKRLIERLGVLVYETDDSAPAPLHTSPPPVAGGLRIVDPDALRQIAKQKMVS